jgi:DNA-binding NtrC family response regulator
VRELQNTVERAVILVGSGRQIESLDLGLTETGMSMASGRGAPVQATASDELVTLAEVERAHILGTLERMKGNRTHASAALGISLRTMRNKLAIYRDEEKAAGKEG